MKIGNQKLTSCFVLVVRWRSMEFSFQLDKLLPPVLLRPWQRRDNVDRQRHPLRERGDHVHNRGLLQHRHILACQLSSPRVPKLPARRATIPGRTSDGGHWWTKTCPEREERPGLQLLFVPHHDGSSNTLHDDEPNGLVPAQHRVALDVRPVPAGRMDKDGLLVGVPRHLPLLDDVPVHRTQEVPTTAPDCPRHHGKKWQSRELPQRRWRRR